MGDIGRNRVLENYINDLIGRGYKKKDIKKKLLEGGYDSLIVNKYLYPYASVLMVAGIILVVMIVVFGGVAAYFIITDGTGGDGDDDVAGAGIGDVSDGDMVADDGADSDNPSGITPNTDPVDERVFSAEGSLDELRKEEVLGEVSQSFCLEFFEIPEKYEGTEYYDDLVAACNEIDLETPFDCSSIEDEVWGDRCLRDIERFGYFRSEESYLLRLDMGVV